MPKKDADFDKNYSPSIDPPDWNRIDFVSNKMEKIFAEETEGLGVIELQMIMDRLELIFEDYRMRCFMEAYTSGQTPPKVDHPGTSDHMYK